MFARSHRIVPGVLLGFLLAVSGWAEENKNPGAASPEQCLAIVQKALKAGDAKALESVCTANVFGWLLPPGTKNPEEHLKQKSEFLMAYSFLERKKDDVEVRACQNHGNNAFATTTYLTFQNVNGRWFWSSSERINI